MADEKWPSGFDAMGLARLEEIRAEVFRCGSADCEAELIAEIDRLREHSPYFQEYRIASEDANVLMLERDALRAALCALVAVLAEAEKQST